MAYLRDCMSTMLSGRYLCISHTAVAVGGIAIVTVTVSQHIRHHSQDVCILRTHTAREGYILPICE